MCLPVAKYAFKVEREWEHAGLKCAVVQGRPGSNRCGYVRVPKTHAAFGRKLDHYDRCDRPICDAVEVHGGITFSQIEPCAHEDGRGFWFGFDCAHAGDAMYEPGNEPDYVLKIREEHPEFANMDRGDHWWTHKEVVAETERLAESLAAVTTLMPPRSVRFAQRLQLNDRSRVWRRKMRRLSGDIKKYREKVAS